MEVSINSSEAFALQTGVSQASSSKINFPSNNTKDENPFVMKMEKSSSRINFETAYKIELKQEKSQGTFSAFNKEEPVKKNLDANGTTFQKIDTKKHTEEMARKSWNEMNETTLKSAVKLYSILKGDILLENFFDFKTGTVDFFA